MVVCTCAGLTAPFTSPACWLYAVASRLAISTLQASDLDFATFVVTSVEVYLLARHASGSRLWNSIRRLEERRSLGKLCIIQPLD